MGILEFLNLNSGAVTAISTVFLTIITFVYVLLTRSISKETEMMRKAQTAPNISVTIQSEEESINLIDLIIKNIGLGPAYNVKFEINPDFEDRFLSGKLSDIGFIKNGLPYFAPNQEFKILLTNITENDEEKLKKAFEIEQIKKNINHISTGFTKLKVIRYTKEDIDEENKQFLEQFKQQKAERDNTKQVENE